MKLRPTRRSWLASLGLAMLCAGCVTAGCISPTLPVPPPLEPDVSKPDGAGWVTVTGKAGSVESEARVYVTNYTLKLRDPVASYIVGQDAATNGSYSLRIQGKTGDLLFVTQAVHAGESAATEVKVP